jgi:Asp-tRNA(Asn)/Glu-tRNA(Gln) amidotransferase C subunit
MPITMQDLEALARTMNVTIPAEYKEGVLAQFQRIESIAANVNAFPIAQDVEPATVFSNDRR